MVRSAFAWLLSSTILFGGAPELVCNGIADDSDAMEAIIQAWGTVQLPVGTCNLSRTIVGPDHPNTIQGHGPDQTILRWTTSANGIVGAYSSAFNKSVIVRDLSLVTAAGGGSALTLDWPDNVWSGYMPTARIVNVTIRGEGNVGWHVGLHLVDAWNATIEGVTINGGYPTGWNAFTSFLGVGIAGRSIGVRVNNLNVNWVQMGFGAWDSSEGLNIIHSNFVGNRWGVFVDSPEQRPGLFLSANHMASIEAGIRIYRRIQGRITDNEIYQWGGPSEGTFTGIVVGEGSETTSLIGNYIMGKSVGEPSIGIDLRPHTAKTTAIGNTMELVQQQIKTGGDTTVATVLGMNR